MRAMAKKTSKDRHKGKRHTVALRPDEYAALCELAIRNQRPVLWEIRRILHEALEAAELWPPKQEGTE
jgi:hypothetical protein